MRFTCKNCGKGFDGRKDSKYCSQSCYRLGVRGQKRKTRSDKGTRKANTIVLQVQCPGCGKDFERRESDTRKSTRIYCNQECFGKHGAHLTRGGRPRKRPGGVGLPPDPEPETLEAHSIWPVKSWFEDKGYTLLYMPGCKYTAQKSDRIYQHRLVMSVRLDRRLLSSEHVDHIIPVAAGGTDEYENLQLLTPGEHGKKTRKEDVGQQFKDLIEELGIAPETAFDRIRRSLV